MPVLEFTVATATTNDGAVNKRLLTDTIAATSFISKQTASLNTSDIQSAGGVLSAEFNVGSALPANARLVGAEVQTTQAITGGVGFVSAVCSVQASGETTGAILAAADATATGFKGAIGTNPYLSRGGQQITVKITLVGINLSAITGGAVTVNLFYSVVS